MKGNSFGKRGVTRHVPPREAMAWAGAAPEFESTAVSDISAAAVPPARELSPEEELEAWKAERMRSRFARMPWRQLYVMAGLCFGVGAFALPDAINNLASWLLFALMAASFYAALVRRREQEDGG